MENISEKKDLIDRYLALNIKQQFNLDFNLKDEYRFAENLVTKKTIIASTFSDKILSNPQVKLFLSSLIAEINNINCSTDFIRNKLKYFHDSDREAS
jgi:hypothetical protein